MIYKILGIYFLLINLISFCMMGLDKNKAKRNKWRIPEKALFCSALLGGSLGAIISMRIFHHKTRHWYFVWGMPFILFVQLVLTVGLYYYFK